MGSRWVYRRPHFPAHKPKIHLGRGQVIRAIVRRRHQLLRRRHIIQAKATLVMGVAAAAPQVGHVVTFRPRIRFKIPRPIAAHAKVPLQRPTGAHVFVRTVRRTLAGRPTIRVHRALPRPPQEARQHTVVGRRKIRRPIGPHRVASRAKIILRQQANGQTLVRALRRSFKARRIVRKRLFHPQGPFAGRTSPTIRHVRAVRSRRVARALRRIQPHGVAVPGRLGPLRRMLKAVGRMRRMMQARLRWKPRPEFVPPVIVPPVIHAIDRGTIYSAGAVEASIYSAGSKRGEVL